MRKLTSAVPRQILLIGWTALGIVPFVLIVLLAFRPEKDIFAYPLGFGGDFTMDHFIRAWSGPPGGVGLGVYFANTALIAVTALAVTLGFGVPAAYFATQLGQRARRLFMACFLACTVIPFVLLIVPLYQIFDTFSLISQPAAVGVTYGVLALPTTVLVLHAFFSDFPTELIEAGAIDGLSGFGAFRRIVLPLSKGAIVGVSLLALIFVWGEAQIGVPLLQKATSQSVAVGILGFKGQFVTQLGPIFAGLAIASVPIIIVYLILHRHIAKGIALGGVFR